MHGGCRSKSRNESPESRARTSSAATSSAHHDSRGSSLRVSADPSTQPSFRADSSSGWQDAPYPSPSRQRHARPHSSSAATLSSLPQQPPPLPRASDLRASGDAPVAAGEPEHVRRSGDEPPAPVGGGGRSGAPTPPFTAAGTALSKNSRRESSRSGRSTTSHRSGASRMPSTDAPPDRSRTTSRSQSRTRSRTASRPESRGPSRTSSRKATDRLTNEPPESPPPQGRIRRHVFRSVERSTEAPAPSRARPPTGSRRVLHSTGSSAVTPRPKVSNDPQPNLWWNRQLHTIDSTSIRRAPPPVSPATLHRGTRGSVPGGVWYPASQSGVSSPPRRRITGPAALSWSAVDEIQDAPGDRRWSDPRASHPQPPAAGKPRRRTASSTRSGAGSIAGTMGVSSVGVAALPPARSLEAPQLHVSGGIGRHRLDDDWTMRTRSPSPGGFRPPPPALLSHPLSVDGNRSVSSSGSRQGSFGGGIGSGRVYPQGSYRGGWIPPGNK